MQFTANADRVDPYRNFKFCVYFSNKPTEAVAAVHKVGPVKKTTEMVEYRAGGDASTSHKMPGKTSYEAITLEQGLTHDTAFEEWANLVNNYQSDADMSLKGFRRDITIEVRNLQGNPVMAYNVYRCWVSEYQALPELDASGNAVAIQTLKLENEGWERDASVTEPTET